MAEFPVTDGPVDDLVAAARRLIADVEAGRVNGRKMAREFAREQT